MAFNRRICIAFLLLLTLNASLSIADEDCPPISQKNLRKLGLANNELALKLLKRPTIVSSVKFISPLSISLAFGMLFYGARGNTAIELRRVLGYEKADLSSDLVHCTFHRLLTQDLRSVMNVPEYTLNLANAIFVDKNLELIPDYKTGVKNLYLAPAQNVDFKHNSDNIVKGINAWVKDRTNGKIDRLLDRLDTSTVMVLLNAVYFKGTWITKFDPKETRSQPFYNDGLEVKNVPMMRIQAHFPYTQEEDLKALTLPYKGENLCMLVLLPNQRDGLANLVNNLTPERISTIRENLKNQTVKVSLPKFKIAYAQELTSDFKALGANSIFNPGSADFSGMTRGERVFVSQIHHKAVVEVNEEGSEAAGATGITVITKAMPRFPQFTVDHPFMFVIMDDRSDMILFAGRVNKL